MINPTTISLVLDVEGEQHWFDVSEIPGSLRSAIAAMWQADEDVALAGVEANEAEQRFDELNEVYVAVEGTMLTAAARFVAGV